MDLIKSDKWQTYYLNNNYRCGQKIIDIATKIILQADDIINVRSYCKSDKIGKVTIESKYFIDKYIEKIKTEGNYKDWFFLVRTNKDLVKLENKLIDYELPYISFKKGDMTLEEMRKAMIDNKIKLLTIHTSKGLESKNVLLWGNFPIVEKPYRRNSDERKVLYVGCTRALDNLIILN